MRVLFFGILTILCIFVNGLLSVELDEIFDVGFAKPQLGCEVLGLIYCCMILTGYQKVIENGLVTKAMNLKKVADDNGLPFDKMVKDVTKPLTNHIEGLGLGIVIDSLGFNDLFKMVSDGDLSKEEIVKTMYDKIQNSGLKRENINKVIVQKCPNWRYPTDPTGKGLIHVEDRNGVSIVYNRDGEKKQIDCDALDFFYCCLTSNTLLRSSESSQTKMFVQLKRKAEKNGQSIKDILNSALNGHSPSFRTYILLDWMNDSKLSDDEMVKKISAEVNAVTPKQDKEILKKLLKEKCFNKLVDTDKDQKA